MTQAMSTTAKAHGMDGTLVEPDWPPLTLEEARALLAEFPDCEEPSRILSVSPRPFSAASVVAAASRTHLHQAPPHDRPRPRGTARRALLHESSAGARRARAACPCGLRSARRQSKTANGPMRCMRFRRVWTFMRTRSPGRRFTRPVMRALREKCWRGCIWLRKGSTRRVARLAPLVAGFTIFAAR